MSTMTLNLKHICLLVAVIAWPALGSAQVPVDESGNPVAAIEPEAVAGTEDLPILSGPELEGIIGPIALYPDDLLAIVLPASTYPLQIVQAARFLKDLESDPSLTPNPDWDDSIVALSNYPEVVEMMADDLDWTWRLGEAVVAQQPAVIAAIERFRNRAYAAGNLKSDDHQTIAQEDGVIQITPVQEDVIYVPYYEPERVVVYQPRPVYYYYPRPYPVYYYPYPSGYAFNDGFFWGVTSAFSIGWYTDRLHIYHHSYHGHPYYGHSYRDNWWYRRPNIHAHNNYYVTKNKHVTTNRYRDGDYWRPQERRTVRSSDQRITRTRYFPNGNTSSTRGTADTPRMTYRSANKDVELERASVAKREERGLKAPRGSELGEPGNRKRQSPKADIKFRDRQMDTARTTTNRPSANRPSTQDREPQVRGNEPRKSQVRRSEPRQRQVAQSMPRQPKATRAPSQRPQVRQSQRRQVQPKPTSQPQRSQSQPRQAQPKPSSQPQRSQSQSRPSKQSKPSKAKNSSKRNYKSSKNSSSSRSRSDRD